MNVVLRGKYQIVREIARSNDIVYEAMDLNLGRRVALKELNLTPGITGQAHRERVERFNREARAAGRLSHPNIVSIFDVGEENGRYFIAMEYLEGQNLRDMLQVRGALPLREAINFACQILDALGYAHANRVIHRDIKPDNIHILPGGIVKLTDFGIARLTEEPALTSNGQVFGTPSYMSPEQIEGRSIDHRSDLFSAGIVLYEMLTGRKPFIGDSVVSITYAIMNADAPSMGGVPMGVEQVVRRALSKQPGQRQISAEQMKLDLRAAEQTPPAFFTQSGMTANSSTMGTGGFYAQPGPFPTNQGPYPGATGNHSMPSGMSGSLPPQLPTLPAQTNGLPWSWNGANQSVGQGIPAVLTSPTQAPTQPQGFPPGGIPPQGFLPLRADPVFTLTPASKTMLLSVLIAIVLGGGIAIGIVGFQHSYEQYKENVSAQQVATLVNQGAAAYGARDYAAAVKFFEQAYAIQPVGDQRNTVIHNLTASYIQLARVDRANGKLNDARDLYQKALTLTPDDAVAHSDMAQLLETLQRPEDARKEREASTTLSPDRVTESLRVDTLSPTPGAMEPPGAVGTSDATSRKTGASDTMAFVNDRRAQARQKINDGLELQQQGDVDGARQKWREAMGLAPGTQERTTAQQLLNSTDPPASDAGG